MLPAPASPTSPLRLPLVLWRRRFSNLWLEKRTHREQMLSRKGIEHRPRQRDVVDVGGLSDQRLLTSQVAKLGRERRWEEALALFASEPEPNVLLRGAIVDACARSMQPGFAWQLFQAMPQKTVSAYNSLIIMHGRRRRPDISESLVQDMRSACLVPNAITFTNLINAHGLARDVDSALRTLDQMRLEGHGIDRITYGVVLSACARAGEKERALETLAQMEATGMKADLPMLNSIIVSCARTKDEPAAKAALENMLARGLKPDVITYTSYIACFPIGPDALPRAEAVLQEMRQAGVEPDAFTYNSVLDLCLACENLDKFREIVAELTARGIQPTAELSVLQRRAEDMALERAAAAGPSAAVPSAAVPSPVPLPEGWQEAQDPASGRAYYWNVADPAGTTTWERPLRP